MKNLEEILKELGEIAPELSKLDKKQFDEVPAKYFSSFPDAIMKKIREQELTQIAPTLAQQEKQNVLEVPANYFKAFPQQMMEKISAEQKSNTAPKWQQSLNNFFDGVASIIFKPKYAFAFAGTVSMMIIGIMFFTKVEQCTDLDCKMASLTDTEINSYLDNDSDVYSDEIFESAVDESTNTGEIYKDALKDISDEELNNVVLD